MATYIDASDVTARFDVSVLGDCLSDDPRVRLTESELEASPGPLDPFILDACGRIDTALLAGKRYLPSELAALSANSEAHLKRMCCSLVLIYVIGRRPGTHTDIRQELMTETEAFLKQLSSGEEVFQLTTDAGHIDAGVPSQHEAIDVSTILLRKTVTNRLKSHLFATEGNNE